MSCKTLLCNKYFDFRSVTVSGSPILLFGLLVALNPLCEQLVKLVDFSLLLLYLLIIEAFQLTDSLLPLEYLVLDHDPELGLLGFNLLSQRSDLLLVLLADLSEFVCPALLHFGLLLKHDDLFLKSIHDFTLLEEV